MSDQDTIYALSSGALPSGVAVVRVSGNRTRFALETFCGSVPEPRNAALKTIRSQNDLIIDRGLVLFFEGPNSFTGEDSAEFHLHGGRAVIDALFAEFSKCDGFRLAEAGEFTKRAFDHGKMDLTSAEGLADLLASETEMQRRIALDQSFGGLKEIYQGWSQIILRSRALIEAELDFSDEEDIPGSVSDQVWADIRHLVQEMTLHLDRAKYGEIARSGYSIVIVGAPNVGKSTLLNALAGRDVAIVTEQAGTTRDVLEVKLDIDGYAVLIKDTAGIRKTDDIVEMKGIDRARTEAESAHLILHLVDFENREQDPLAQEAFIDRSKLLTIQSKMDESPDILTDVDFSISGKTGDGISELLSGIADRLHSEMSTDDYAVPTRKRHIDYLTSARAELENALSSKHLDIELRTEMLRIAQESLGKITGHVDVEDLLGVIFSEFCVGK